MGTVFKGLDTQTNLPVALKLLKSEALSDKPELIERFRREGEALRQLNHPNIVKMLDMIEDDGKHYLIMEYVSGGDLAGLLVQGEMSIQQALNIAIDLADALTRTHKLGIVHRDLKPANALIADDGTLRLTDFGIAQDTTIEQIANKNSILGTLYYLAPEVLRNEAVDNRSDIWSFGIMLYEMLSGQLPFVGESVVNIIESILGDPVPDLETLNPDCPIELVDLVYRMLKKDRSNRIRSVRYIGAELEDLLNSIDRGILARLYDTSKHIGDLRRFETFTVLTDDDNHNLPAQTTAFVGRALELDTLTSLIQDSGTRLVTILAQGGMGKTRLALETGTRFIDSKLFSNGVYFVQLAPLSSIDNIIATIAQALNFQLAGEGTAEEQILNYLRAKKILLIMDNYEHLLDGGVDIIEAILQAAPSVKIIATSRVKLGVYGETVFSLSGLDVPDLGTSEDTMDFNAVKLFMQSANRIMTQYELQQDDLPYLTRICQLTYGMPLAIELAAAWVEMLSLQEIAEEIEQSLDFLETDMRNIPVRHQSIRAVFDYSFQLLSADEQTNFIKFAVFRGNFSRKAAQAITGIGLRDLTALVNKSLLQRNPETGYYSIHQLLRQYAQEELESRGQLLPLLDTYSNYYLQTCYDAKDELCVTDQLKAARNLENELENIQAAILHAIEYEHYEILTLGISVLWRFYLIRGHRLLGENLFTLIVKKLEQKPSSPQLVPVLGEAQIYLFLFKYVFHQYLHSGDEVEVLLQQCTDKLQGTDKPYVKALLATIHADYHCIYRKVEDSRPYCKAAISICKELNDTWLESYNWRSLGDTYWYRTQYNPDIPNAVQLYETANTIVQSTNDIYSRDRVLKTMGVLARLDSRIDDAYQLHIESMKMCEQLGNHHALATTLYNIGYMAFIQYHHKDARTYLQRCLDLRQEIGEVLLTLMPLGWLGHLELAEGKFAAAREIFKTGAAISEELSTGFFLTFFYAGLGMADVAEGKYEASEPHFSNALATWEARDKYHVENVYRSLGIRSREQNNFKQALSSFIMAIQFGNILDDISGLIDTHIQIAWLYYRNGDYDKVKTTIDDTMTLMQKEKMWPVIMMCRFQAYTLLGNIEHDPKIARQHYSMALSAIGQNYPIPQMVIFIGSVAEHITQDDYAAELAAFIANFEGSYASDKRRADELLAKIEVKLDKDIYDASIERGKSGTIEAIVSGLRDEFKA